MWCVQSIANHHFFIARPHRSLFCPTQWHSAIFIALSMDTTIAAIYAAAWISSNAQASAVLVLIWPAARICMYNRQAQLSRTPDRSIVFVWRIALIMPGSEWSFISSKIKSHELDGSVFLLLFCLQSIFSQSMCAGAESTANQFVLLENRHHRILPGGLWGS